ncbi:MAG: hypothetical protein JKY81_08230 [Colwellia sp.]|nr:hypothetical protein [Colwellia sp.]
MDLFKGCSLRFFLLSSIIVSFHAKSDELFKDVRFITGVSMGESVTNYEERLDQDIALTMVNVTLAVATSNWQLSLNGGSSLGNAVISEEEETGEASRYDVDLTLGYQISKHWIIFTGYKNGGTKLLFVPRDAEESDNPDGIREEYTQKGFYFGTSYSLRFEKAGRLALSIAYANFDGINSFQANVDDLDEEEDEEIEFDDLTGTVNGDVSGFSYGLTWSMPLSSNLIFQSKIKINRYQQDIEFNGLTFNNIDENYRSLQVGLAYVF